MVLIVTRLVMLLTLLWGGAAGDVTNPIKGIKAIVDVILKEGKAVVSVVPKDAVVAGAIAFNELRVVLLILNLMMLCLHLKERQ
ncbi:hypothetical protein bhDAH_001131 (plasmid) [Borrelia hermsii DAH]|nr:hypothetical protein bhDAH_001131 [Borrelia hermsii DAH]